MVSLGRWVQGRDPQQSLFFAKCDDVACYRTLVVFEQPARIRLPVTDGKKQKVSCEDGMLIGLISFSSTAPQCLALRCYPSDYFFLGSIAS